MGNTALFGKLKFAPDRPRRRQRHDQPGVVRQQHADQRAGHRRTHCCTSSIRRSSGSPASTFPGPNYHQGETRLTFNYNRQLTNWARVVETFGYRDVQLKFIDDGDFIGEPYSLARQTVTMYPFSQQADEDIYYQEARLELSPTAGGDASTP